MIILVAFVFASLLNTTGDMANDGLPTPTAPLVQSASPVSPSLSEKPSEKPDVIDKKDSAKWTDIISAYGTLAGAIVVESPPLPQPCLPIIHFARCARLMPPRKKEVAVQKPKDSLLSGRRSQNGNFSTRRS